MDKPTRPRMRPYRVLVAMSSGKPPKWVTMIGPDLDEREARRSAELRWGKRALKIAPQKRITKR